MAKVVVVGGLVLLAAGCIFPKAGALPGPVTAADVDRAKMRWPDANEPSLTAGRALFVAHCNGCHGYPALVAIREDRWPAIVEKMARKANLDAAQGLLLQRFVLTARVR